MQEHHRTLIRRTLIGAAIGVALGATFTATGTAEWSPRPEVETASTPDPIVMAEQTVAQKVAERTRGRNCYQDPTGHGPSFAVVKLDGTTIVRTVTADTAWKQAHDGAVWVEAWCSDKEQS